MLFYIISRIKTAYFFGFFVTAYYFIHMLYVVYT